MSLSKASLQLLVDLVEIKLSCIEVIDREDAREYKMLESTLAGLHEMMAVPATVLSFPVQKGDGAPCPGRAGGRTR